MVSKLTIDELQAEGRQLFRESWAESPVAETR